MSKLTPCLSSSDFQPVTAQNTGHVTQAVEGQVLVFARRAGPESAVRRRWVSWRSLTSPDHALMGLKSNGSEAESRRRDFNGRLQDKQKPAGVYIYLFSDHVTAVGGTLSARLVGCRRKLVIIVFCVFS